MFEVGKVFDNDATILMWMSEVCVRGQIKIHIHPVLKLLIRREEGIYIYNYDNYVTIQDIVRTKHDVWTSVRCGKTSRHLQETRTMLRAQSQNWWN